MTPEERDTFLRAPETAILSTVSEDGRIHSVPIWYLWDGETVRISTARDSVKIRNIRRNPRASFCSDRSGPMTYVSFEGPVEIIDPITESDRLALWTHYRDADVAREVVARGGTEKQVLLVLRPEHWLTS